MSSALRVPTLKTSRERLDKFLVARGYAESRERAQGMILAGQIWVEGQPAKKAGLRVPLDVQVEVRTAKIVSPVGARRYVGRGGLKLEHALTAFKIHPVGWVAMDVGASTGGFTDCLLQHGAKKVFAVDVGYGQLAWKLRQDPRVIVIERTNIRYLKGPLRDRNAPPTGCLRAPTGDLMDLITVDLSFISLRLVLPKLLEFLKPDGWIVALVKPQFEVGKGQVGRGGLVKDSAKHQEVLAVISQAAAKTGLTVEGITPSPLPGRKGNQEYFIYCISRGGPLKRAAAG